MPDPLMGEEPCAWIRLAAGETCTEGEIALLPRSHRSLQDSRAMSFSSMSFPSPRGNFQTLVIRERMIKEPNLSVEATA